MQWSYAKIGDFADLVKGRTPPRQNKNYYAAQGLPWVKIENLKQREVRNSEEYLSVTGERVGKTVPPGSVLLSANRTIGKVGIAEVPLQTNEQIISIICGNYQYILPEYLYFYLMFSEKNLQKRAYVTVGSRVSTTMLKEWIVPVAPMELQYQWTEKLILIEDVLQKKEEMLMVLEKIRGRRSMQVIISDAEKEEFEHLQGLLQESVAVTRRLLNVVLNQLFWNAEQKKEEIYYGKLDKSWVAINDMKELDDTVKALLQEMSFFQQCLYRAFYSADGPMAIHTVLKGVKEKESSLSQKHIQDAIAAVENFRQLGLMIKQEQQKLYYTVDKREGTEVTDGNDKEVTIGLWNCNFPKNEGSGENPE